jgi:hypothetical protein
VCDDVAPLPLVPSPNAHAHETTEPSGSQEPCPSNVHDPFLQLHEYVALGSWFAVVACATVETELPQLLNADTL